MKCLFWLFVFGVPPVPSLVFFRCENVLFSGLIRTTGFSMCILFLQASKIVDSVQAAHTVTGTGVTMEGVIRMEIVDMTAALHLGIMIHRQADVSLVSLFPTKISMLQKMFFKFHLV